MKIMLVAAADSIHTVRWANAFSVRGHDVHLVSQADHKVHADKLSAAVHLYYLPHIGSKGYFLNCSSIRKLWKQICPDVVNVHYASGYGTLVNFSGIRPYVLSVWGSDVYEFPRISGLNLALVRFNLKNADALASTSYAMADQVRKIMQRPDQKITITPFGVDVTRFSPDGAIAPKDAQQFLFGTIKTLSPVYGISYVIEAFYLFVKKWADSGKQGKIPHLFICGRGDKAPYEQLRDSLGLQSHVEIENYIPNEIVPDKLRSIDVLCLGSLEESFGVAAVEAMACGVPIVATDADGFMEVMEDGKTGVIVPKKDAQAMADKMWQLYRDDQMRQAFGKNGRQRVLTLYNWEDNVDTLLNLLIQRSKH